METKLKNIVMAFGIIRARNLNSSDINSTDKHNARRYENGEYFPQNIKQNGKFYEFYFSKKADVGFFTKEDANLKQIIDERLKENNVTGIRKNSNLAIEYVCTISDQKAWENYMFSGYASNTFKWLEERHGRGSVVAQYNHFDESNPHVHFVVVPLKEKEIKWKNSTGEGVRKETRLNTREFTGGREKLRKLQDDYYKHLCEHYGSGIDKSNKLGVPLYRGTLVENQLKQYIQQTDHVLGELRNELKSAEQMEQKLKIELEIVQKHAQRVEAERKLRDKQQSKKSPIWKAKGTKDLPNVFHKDEKKKKRNRGRGM